MKKAVLLSAVLTGGATFGQADLEQVWQDSADAYWARIEAEFADSAHSPLKADDRAHFAHLERFAYDPRFHVTARFKPARRPKEFQMKTTTARLPLYRPYGTLVFKLEGRTFELPVYQNIDLIKKPGYENHLFLPFTDLTNGEETYGGGRYVDLQGPLEEEVTVDLNKAYNPYCAYNERYSCPIPPEANHIDLRVPAGVKKFHE